MPAPQFGASVRPTIVYSRNWSFVGDENDVIPLFDSETMDYMIYGQSPKDCLSTTVQGYIMFRQPTIKPNSLQLDYYWSSFLGGDTFGVDVYLIDSYHIIKEFGTSPLSLQRQLAGLNI